MGLLDVLNSDQGRLGLSLLAAAGPSPVPQSFGQRLMGGMQAYQQQKDDEAMRAARTEQLGLLRLKQQMELEQIRRAQQFRDSLPSPQAMANQTALGGGGGPTMANAAKMPSIDPMLQQLHGAMKAGLIDPLEYLKATQPKAPDYKVVGDSLLQVGPSGVKEAYRAPAKPEAMPSAVREYQFAQQQGYPGTFQQFVLEQKRAGATNVKVDTGPKAFDTELGKFAVDTFGKQREAAQLAAGVLQSVGEIRKAAQGGAYQGAGAELKLGAAKALGALGMPYDAKTVANSELFSAQANQFVLNSIKGLGANPSNADREFIEKTVPRLQTDPAALPKLLEFMERKARTQLQSYNKTAQQVQSRASYLPLSLEVTEPQIEPAGLTPAEQAELESLRARLGGRR